MKYAHDILQLIGSTPMLRLKRLVNEGSAEILVKLESFNPGGSVKDRIAYGMVLDAEEKGLLKPGGTIIEPTSGNTGVGLAMVAASRGYRLILVMPDSMSVERRSLFSAYGAEVVLTPGAQGMSGAIAKSDEILQENPDYFRPQQFENPANPEVHRKTTALEILEQTDGKIDAFVAGVGSGGTLTGVGEVLKEKVKGVKIVAVEPFSSAVLSGGKPAPNKVQGLGAGFVPDVLNTGIIDQVIPVRDDDALEYARLLVRQEGIFAGISSGAAVFAGLKVASELGPKKRVVVLLPDTGERYLSVLGELK
jgi:cysteine synthase A